MHSLIEQIIFSEHSGDNDQLNVIFSKDKRLVLEAPAGCGKTHLMISRIAYLMATKQISSTKKILALTFSVNAAYKIKRDAYQKIPALLSGTGSKIDDPRNKVFSTNYHGLARRILRLHGYLLDANLKDIDTFRSVDESNPTAMTRLNIGLTYNDTILLSSFANAIKARDISELESLEPRYRSLIKSFFLPNKCIPYNAILVLANYLLNSNPIILDGYRKLFSHIIVDEFQDTNILSFSFLKTLITNNTTVLLMGDSLQRIYGFIGAMPNLIDYVEKHLDFKKYTLTKNYRFLHNSSLLAIDNVIRENARSINSTPATITAELKLFKCSDQISESNTIAKIIKHLSELGPSKIAILVRSRGNNTNLILDALASNSIDYFYALFSDDDLDYIRFHAEVKKEFVALTNGLRTFNKLMASRLIKTISSNFNCANKKYSESMILLLQSFLKNVFTEHSFANYVDTISFIIDTLDGNALKQSLGSVDNNVIVTTVHAAKGLEWDHVILPDFEQSTFPHYFGMCRHCKNQTNCDLTINKSMPLDLLNGFFDEMSVFYVSATRAKQDLFLTSSQTGVTQQGHVTSRNRSCLLNMNGISISYCS